jgi:hypothetical protein
LLCTATLTGYDGVNLQTNPLLKPDRAPLISRDEEALAAMNQLGAFGVCSRISRYSRSASAGPRIRT